MAAAKPTEDHFLELLQEQEPRLRQYLYYCGIETGDMDEVLQDILITAWRKSGDLQDLNSLGAWLKTMAQRKAIRYRRNKERYWKRNYPLSFYEEEREEAGLPVPDDLIYVDPEDFHDSEVYEMVMSLGYPASNIIMLFHVYKEPFEDICATLGLNENTARSIASRSRSKLRKLMEERRNTPYGKK